MNVTEQLADATRRWAQAKAKVAEAEQEMLELSKAVEPEDEPLSGDARIERCRNAIKAERERRCWSQQKLGLALGFSPGTAQARVSQIENGYRELAMGLFERIADAFGLTPAQLEATFSATPAPPTPPKLSRRKQRIVEALRRSSIPLTIGVVADRAQCTTSDAYADLLDLMNDRVVVAMNGGYVLKEQLARGVTRSEAA